MTRASTSEPPAGSGLASTQSPGPDESHKRPRVIYVMGAGRSGSTTLGITLGNCAGVFYAGELDNWLARSGRPQVEDSERSTFWTEVGEALDDADRASALFGDEAQRSIERSVSLLRVRSWPARYRLRRRYREVAGDLFGALSRVTKAACIADTSHYPLRARELQRVGGIELHLVFLMRDPQAVVASFNRRDVGEYSKATLHTNVYLWVTHLLSLLVFLRHPRDRRLFVQYEDFIADPAGVIRQILQSSGCPAATLPDFTSLDVGVPLQGNRVTRSRTLALKGKTDQFAASSRLTAVLQAPLLALLPRLRPRAEASPGHRAGPPPASP